MHDQAENLRRQLVAAKHVKQQKQAKVVSFISGKGGVGKSNIALNFSLELLKKGKKVLLFDLDIGMGNIEILLGLHAKKTIVDLFDNHLTIHDIIETTKDNLAFIAGGSGLNHFFTLDNDKMDYFFQQFNEIAQEYDYLIFDMGAGATNDSLFFVLASDECIVITTPEPTSITDAYSMIKHIIKNRQNMPIYVVMNRAKTSKTGTNALNQFRQVIRNFLNVEINILGILPDDKFVTTAVIKQIPYVLLNDKAAISRAVANLVLNYEKNINHVKEFETVSFVHKLKQLIRKR